MILTDNFVMIAYPKTGSSFARTIIKRLHDNKSFKLTSLLKTGKIPYLKEFLTHQNDIPGLYQEETLSQHGRVEQIPDEHKHKPVVSILRNPFTRYISLYEYGWYKSYPAIDKEKLLKLFPAFPELSFEDFLRYSDYTTSYRIPGITLKAEMGCLTVQFFQFFLKNPTEVIPVIDDDYIFSGKYIEQMPEIEFLRTDQLNEDLYAYLLKKGYPARFLEFIKNSAKVRPENTARSTDEKRKTFYTETLINKVQHKERLLLKICEDFGCSFERPRLSDRQE